MELNQETLLQLNDMNNVYGGVGGVVGGIIGGIGIVSHGAGCPHPQDTVCQSVCGCTLYVGSNCPK